MNCPRCSSANVRLSTEHSLSDAFHSLMGHWAWRCRQCRRRFHAGESPSANQAARRNAPPRHRKQRAIIRSRHRRRRVIEVAIFSLLLIIFLLFLRYLTREPPTEESGQIPAGVRVHS